MRVCVCEGYQRHPMSSLKKYSQYLSGVCVHIHTLVGKYLLVLNCLRKDDRKKVVKKRMMDQKRTSGTNGSSWLQAELMNSPCKSTQSWRQRECWAAVCVMSRRCCCVELSLGRVAGLSGGGGCLHHTVYFHSSTAALEMYHTQGRFCKLKTN